MVRCTRPGSGPATGAPTACAPQEGVKPSAWASPLPRDPEPQRSQPPAPAVATAGDAAATAANPKPGSGPQPATGQPPAVGTAERPNAWAGSPPRVRCAPAAAAGPGAPPAPAACPPTTCAAASKEARPALAAAPGGPHKKASAAADVAAVPPAAAVAAAASAAPILPPSGPPPPPPTIESLPPDVMHRVLLFGSCRDAASLKLVNRRLHATVRGASSHWGPLVEARMQQSPHLRGLWARIDRGGAAAGAGSSDNAAGAAEGSVDWLQVWCCLERATQGPWSLDVTRLSRAAAPHGVLLIFELLLQHIPPMSGSDLAAAVAAAAPAGPAPAGPAAAAHAATPGRAGAAPVVVQQHAWKDNVSVLSFCLDGRRVEVVVDTTGRLSSPQHDWCQGSLVLTPGVPRLVTLEVSYLLPVPAWFVHPATIDEATGRLMLDLSCGFGSFVTDPRYSPDTPPAAAAAAAGTGGALQRLELCGRLAWRPSRVASFFNRLLNGKAPASCKAGSVRAPSPRYGGGASSGGGSSGVAVPGCVSVGRSSGGPSGGAPAHVLQPPPPPPPASSTHLLAVSKVAAWQVPADTEWRFAEGFMFAAEDHKAEQLLARYGLLQPPAPPCHSAAAAAPSPAP